MSEQARLLAREEARWKMAAQHSDSGLARAHSLSSLSSLTIPLCFCLFRQSVSHILLSHFANTAHTFHGQSYS